MKNDLVTIRSFADSHEAATLRCFLESEGIMTVMQGEFFAQIYPFSSASGNVKLQVRGEDLELAIDLLKKGGYLCSVQVLS